MSNLLIRPASAADIPAIAAIYRPAVTDGLASWELAPPDDAEMRRRYESIVAGGYPYFAAELDGRVAGYAYVSAYRPRPGYRYTVENSVYVAADCQRSGAGRALLAALIERCTQAGYRQMVAIIGDSANAASIGLHRAAGFTLKGTLSGIGWKQGRWLDSVIMQRALGAGDATPPL